MSKTIVDLVKAGATKFGHKLAFANGVTNLTYQELWERSQNGARQLGPGGPVILRGRSGPEWMVGLFSILCAGRCAVPVPPNTSSDSLGHIIDHAGVETIVCSSSLRIGIHPQEVFELETLGVNDHQGELPVVTPEDTALIAFTSGSTQNPKAVILTHKNIMANIEGLVAVQQVDANDTFLSLLPPHHLFELVVGNLAPMTLGAPITYPNTLLPNRIIKALQTDGITYMLVVPALLGLIAAEIMEHLIDKGLVPDQYRNYPITDIANLELENTDVIANEINRIIGPTLESIVVGGAGISPAWNELFKTLGRDLYVGYGLTEASPILTCTRTTDCPAGSVGKPLPNVQLKISDGGEILASGPNIMKGYLGDRRCSENWFATGDLGRIDHLGNLFIEGRSKEAMVTSGGETIFPEEIEPFYQHTSFHECCVVPLDGADGNDRPVLVVYPKESNSNLKELMNELTALAPAKAKVREFIEVDYPLPRTELGKIQRRKLANTIKEESK